MFIDSFLSLKVMRILLLFLCFSCIALGQTKTDLKTKATPILVYGSDTCHYCLETKAHLQVKEISFIYYDIDTNEIKLQEMLYKMRIAGFSTSNVQLPVIDKAGELFMNDQDFQFFLNRITTTSKL